MNLRLLATLLALSAVCFPAGLPGQTQRYALLAAINDYPEVPGQRSADLTSCLNDANEIRRWLIEDHRFKDADIVGLFDRNATTRRIVAALDDLARKVRPGDVVVFFFSGHGTQVPDEDGDEEDSLDETLVTYDMVQDIAAGIHEPSRWLTDDVIGRALVRLRTHRVLVVFDCCHSGTATKSFDQFFAAGGAPVAENPAADGIRSKWLPFGFAWKDRARDAEAKGDPRNDRHVYLGACQDFEEAMTAGSLSVLTRHFLATARELPEAGLDVLMERLSPQVTAQVERFRKSGWAKTPQTPRLDGETGWTLNELLGAAPLPGAKAWANEDPALEQAAPPAPDAPARAVTVTVTSDRSRYRIGEFARVTVTSDHAGFLRLYALDAHGNATRILPNEKTPSPRLEAGRPTEFPRPDDPFDFEVIAPTGQETFKAVVSTEPFELDEPPAEVKTRSLSALGTRGIRVKLRQHIGVGYTHYQVLPAGN